MKKLLSLLALVAATPLVAGDFSEGSKAKGWGLEGEQKALFEAKVVDVMCELTGDCPENCADGKRQFGLLRSADDVLIFPMKNGQRSFYGAVDDLAPYCNQTVMVDGLMIENPEIGASNIFMVQFVLADGMEKPVKSNKGTKVWAKRHPEAKGKGPWFRRDPRINAIIAEEGYLGLGLEADKQYAEENF